MERLADFSLLCVSAVLIVALVAAPPSLPNTSVAAASTAPVAEEEAAAEEPVVAEDTTHRPTEARADDSPRRSSRTGPWTEQLGHSPQNPQPELTPEFIEACLAVAVDIDEEMASELRQLRDAKPDEFRVRLQRSRRLISLAELRDRDPVLYKVKILELRTDANVRHLGDELRQAIADERDEDILALEDSLRDELEIQWAFQFKARDEYLCRLQDLVHQMEQQLEFERKNRNTIINKRLQDLKKEPQPRTSPRRGRTLEATDDSADRRPRGRGRGNGQTTEPDAED